MHLLFIFLFFINDANMYLPHPNVSRYCPFFYYKHAYFIIHTNILIYSSSFWNYFHCISTSKLHREFCNLAKKCVCLSNAWLFVLKQRWMNMVGIYILLLHIMLHIWSDLIEWMLEMHPGAITFHPFIHSLIHTQKHAIFTTMWIYIYLFRLQFIYFICFKWKASHCDWLVHSVNQKILNYSLVGIDYIEKQ